MKNKYITTLALAVSLTIASFSANAQNPGSTGGNSNSGNKLFTAFGFCPLLGFEISPNLVYTNYVQQTDQFGNIYYSPTTDQIHYFTYDIYDFIFRIRYNLAEFGNNASLSVSGMPSLGLSYSGAVASDLSGIGAGFLDFNLPIMLEYNLGNVSTYSADQEKGFVVGAGIEYTKAPLFGVGAVSYTDENGNAQVMTIPTGWVEPVFELGYRYWNRSNKARELNLKVGVGGNGAISMRLAWFWYMGY